MSGQLRPSHLFTAIYIRIPWRVEYLTMSDDRLQQSRYNFQEIEKKWQQRWSKSNLFHVEIDPAKPKFYGLVMFPYPSGAGLSVGHCRNYIPLDVVCRYKAMQGYNVLQPMGWDAFGQPAENEAIKRGRNPADMVPEYAANYRRQLNLTGIAYDWDREINSSEPEYYRWTQWIFLKLYKAGLAYRGSAPVNWCPFDKTVLANEEVVNGRCWRCDTPVEKRNIPQWFFRTTALAEQLLEGLNKVQWPEGVKLLQANWIGRSEGAEVEFQVVGNSVSIKVFTTRPDTLPGATFMVLAPEHPLVDSITTADCADSVALYRDRAVRVSEIDRQSTERVKTGVFTGAYAVNPVNGEHIPVYIADYVLMGYGTGAIMAVPAHDQRDFEFAKKYDIPIKLVYVERSDQKVEELMEALPSGGVITGFGEFDGLPNNKSTIHKVIRWLEEHNAGHGVVNYRLRDWLISRQRYWGAPIPIIHCDKCGQVPVPDDQLPVRLPKVEKYEPTGTGESPLAGIPEFVNTVCPECGEPARRETDTMGGSACSSWYFLRYADPHNNSAAFSEEAIRYWLPVDLYCGGAEHAVGHLLYARFWTKALYNAGIIGFDEPFMKYRNQGDVLAYTPGRKVEANETAGEENDGGEPIQDWKVLKPDERHTIPEDQWVWRWARMSKSKGNVVTPDEMAESFGADSLRLFCLFVAPYEENVQWSNQGIEAAHKFVNRVWRIWHTLRTHYCENWRDIEWVDNGASVRALRRSLHQAIRKVGDDIEEFHFNTAVAAIMSLTNDLSAFRNELGNKVPDSNQIRFLSEALETIPLLVSPIMPHVADEWWEELGKQGSVFSQRWPAVDEAAAAKDVITIVVQVNGKIRDKMELPADTPQEEIEKLAMLSEKVVSDLETHSVKKIFVVPGKLINIVLN